MKTDLVSVCIPTYNDGMYIREMLCSIVNQTYADLEIVVLDNASTDNTQDIVNAFHDKRIRYIRNKSTTPPVVNFNNLIKISKGGYVAIYHSDDIYAPTIVDNEVKCFGLSSEIGAVFAMDRLIDEQGKFIGEGVRLSRGLLNKNPYDFNDIYFEMLKRNGSFLVCPTFMAKREIFVKAGYFDETDRFGRSGSAADAEFWLRIARLYKIGMVKDRLIMRRLSPGQDSTSTENSRLTKSNHFLVLEYYLDNCRMAVPDDILNQYKFNIFFDCLFIAKNLVKTGKNKEARELLLRSFNLRILMSSFKNIRNFFVLILFLIMVVSLLVKVRGVCLGVFRLVNKFRPNVPC
jgi:glycosyltransferase involved in cell wall biosynthesis